MVLSPPWRALPLLPMALLLHLLAAEVVLAMLVALQGQLLQQALGQTDLVNLWASIWALCCSRHLVVQVASPTGQVSLGLLLGVCVLVLPD